MADNSVLVEFGAKIDALVAGVDQVKAKLETLNSSAESISGAFGQLGDIIKAALSVEAIVSFVENMAQLGLQTERVMATLGMSAEQVGMLGGLAKVTGTSMEGLALSIERLSLNVQRSTADALNPQAEALRVLGLNAKQLIGIPTAEYIDKLHEAISKFNPSLNLTNAVMAIGGRGIAQIIPLLQMSGEQWERMREAITSAQQGLAAAIPGMAETHMQLELMSMNTQSLSAAIFTALKPAIDGVIGSFTDFVKNVRDMIKEGGALHGVFDVITIAAKALASTVAILTSGVLELGLAFESLGLMIKGVFGGTTVSEMQKQAEAMETVAAQLKQRLDEIWSTPTAVEITKPGGVDARAMNEGLAKGMADRLKVIENEYKLETDLINKQYGDFFFTEGAKTQALLAALDKRYQAEVAAGEKTTVAYSKWALDRQKILDQANKVYEASLNSAFSGLQSAINGQLRGMLAGTTSFASAFKAIIGDMIIWAIEEFEKMAFKWIAHELIQTAATETGVAARAAATASGAEADLPARIAKFTSSITADAAEVFGGIFANLSPFLGPAAAAPAAAGQATVLAEMVNVPKFAVGTDYVTRTGLALIHEGERITPAQSVGPFSGGGTTTVQLSINAVDARSFSNLVNANPGLFSDLIKRAMRDNRLNVVAAR